MTFSLTELVFYNRNDLSIFLESLELEYKYIILKYLSLVYPLVIDIKSFRHLVSKLY